VTTGADTQERRGTIITFYSYKGGTGRTMALANVAWLLASNGHRVLAIDWDLESPGLHRYFHPFLVDKELRGSDGVIDLIREYALAATKPAKSS
jgi:cellulose biosynthesis protein BcsQ